MYSEKLVVFDLFGVIFTKGLESSIDYLKAVFDRPEKDISHVYRKWEEEFDLGLINEKQFWTNINFDLKTDVKPEVLTQIVMSSCQLKTKTIKLAHFLKRDFPLAVYSNYRTEWYKRLNRKYRTSKLFDRIFISSDTKKLKPSFEAYDLLEEYSNCDRSNIILIDDDLNNIKGFNSWGGNGVHFENIYETEILIREIFHNEFPRYNEYYSGVVLETSNGSIVLQRRDNLPGISYPGRLSVFGGRREGQEQPIEIALRETQKEVGLHLTEAQLHKIGEYSCPVENNDWMHCTYFLAEGVNVNELTLNEGKGIEVWSPKEAISRKDIAPLSKAILEKLIES